jgi:hypothetical protein
LWSYYCLFDRDKISAIFAISTIFWLWEDHIYHLGASEAPLRLHTCVHPLLHDLSWRLEGLCGIETIHKTTIQFVRVRFCGVLGRQLLIWKWQFFTV